ncbi:hypothetical protein IJ579_02590 [bacterium]|nr:hypothetical protein [bacterium]
MALEGVQATNVGAAAKPKVFDAGEYNIVMTSNGDVLKVPGRFIGATTKVKVLDDGKYEITTQGVTYPKSEPRTTILTEEELIAKYGPQAGKNLQVVA